MFSTSLENLQFNSSVPNINLRNFGVFSIAFNQDNSILSIQARGGGLGSCDFDSTNFKDITYLGNNQYQIKNGGVGMEGNYRPATTVDRTFKNFTRIIGDDYNTVVRVHLVDGPDCVSSPSNGAFGCGCNRLVYFKKTN